uniref:Uncharacterized protein n=1 Tax=Romanomermis culicivorax TaxID=13658 RepID=A0A915JEA6_ROMCU
MTKILYFDPNVDPACYPVLFPYGTQGHKYGILKADPNNKKANDDLAAQFDAGKEGGTLYTNDDLDWIDDYLDAEDNGMEEIMKTVLKSVTKSLLGEIVIGLQLALVEANACRIVRHYNLQQDQKP